MVDPDSKRYNSVDGGVDRFRISRETTMKSIFLRCIGFSILGLLMGLVPQFAEAKELLVFISSFEKGDQGAIHAYHLDPDSGTLKLVRKTGGVEHPFFIALSKDRKHLYSIHAPGTFGGKENENVAAFQVLGESGELKLLNTQSALGTAACFLEVDATGKTVLVANYTSGSVAALPVREDGSLGAAASFVQHRGSSVDPARQKEPHAHCFVISPDNRFAFAADLGLDQVLAYRLNPEAAKVTPAKVPFAKSPAGAGPRHMTFHPNGKLVYVINELKNSVTVFDYDVAEGGMTEKQTIPTLPADFTGVSNCADLKITPDGKFLYGTNRGHDSIASYRIADDGRLTLLSIDPSIGKGPQNLVITPDGKLLLCANMPGHNVAVFKIDPTTGSLKSTGTPLSIASPSCIRIY